MSDAEKQQKQLLEEAVRLLNNQYESYQGFNEFFDGEDPLSIASSRRDVDAYQFARSKVLFWVDRDAYDDERGLWEDDSNQARHKEVTELIRLHHLVTPFQDLLGAARRGRVVPFIGAGMSKPMGMPLWSEALKLLLARLPAADGPAITAMINSGQHLEAAQALADCDSVQTTNFIRTTYRNQTLEPDGPMLLVPRFAKGCVITTNLDEAIEQSYRNDGVEFHAYMHGTQEHNFFLRLVRGDRCLLKLHGDADNQATHILTRTQYDEAYGHPFDFSKPLPKALRQIFVSQSLLFLGCSLDRDRTLELFEQAKQADEYAIPNHYAVLPDVEDQQARAQKETRLLKLNIQPLWYPADQHVFVQRYLQLIVDVTEGRISYQG